jgi:hypothetical protein
MAALLLLGLALPLSPAWGQAARSDQAEAAELIVPGVSGRFADLFQKRQFHYTGGVYIWNGHPAGTTPDQRIGELGIRVTLPRAICGGGAVGGCRHRQRRSQGD